MVGLAYKASARDLRSIEERSLEDVLESAMGMNLTVSPFPTSDSFFFTTCSSPFFLLTCFVTLQSVLAQYQSIAHAKARNEKLRAELDAAKVALNAAQESEHAAKAALTVAQESEHAAKAALISSQEGEQSANTALSAS